MLSIEFQCLRVTGAHNHKPAMQMMGLLTGHCHFEGHPLVNSPEHHRCKRVQYLQRSHTFFCFSRLWSH